MNDSESSPVEEELNPKSEHTKPSPLNEGLISKLTNENDSLYLRPSIRQGILKHCVCTVYSKVYGC